MKILSLYRKKITIVLAIWLLNVTGYAQSQYCMNSCFYSYDQMYQRAQAAESAAFTAIYYTVLAQIGTSWGALLAGAGSTPGTAGAAIATEAGTGLYWTYMYYIQQAEDAYWQAITDANSTLNVCTSNGSSSGGGVHADPIYR